MDRGFCRKWLLLILGAVGSTACGPGQFLAMQPRQANGPEVLGYSTHVVSHPDSVYVRLGFIRYEPTELIFEAGFWNYSDHPVTIAPETFYYLPLPDTLTGAGPPVPTAMRVAAYNPDQRLLHLTQQLNKEADKAEKVGWFELLTTVSHIAEDVSSISKKETDQQVAERNYRHESDNAYFNEQRAQHAQQADNLYSQKATLEAVALRTTTLEPGQRVIGQVRFPRTDTARQLRLVLFFDERPVIVDFHQQLRNY